MKTIKNYLKFEQVMAMVLYFIGIVCLHYGQNIGYGFFIGGLHYSTKSFIKWYLKEKGKNLNIILPLLLITFMMSSCEKDVVTPSVVNQSVSHREEHTYTKPIQDYPELAETITSSPKWEEMSLGVSLDDAMVSYYPELAPNSLQISTKIPGDSLSSYIIVIEDNEVKGALKCTCEPSKQYLEQTHGNLHSDTIPFIGSFTFFNLRGDKLATYENVGTGISGITCKPYSTWNECMNYWCSQWYVGVALYLSFGEGMFTLAMACMTVGFDGSGMN
jgi:hypothetical protein